MGDLTYHKKSTVRTWYAFVDDGTGAGKTGLVNSDFTKKLFKNEATDATSVTVTELDGTNAPGMYYVTYTPTTTGRWFCFIKNTTYMPAGASDETSVQNDDIDSLIASLLTVAMSTVEGTADVRSLAAAIMMLCHKSSISGSTQTVYKSNNTTPFETYALTFDTAQNPIASSTPA